MTASASLSGRFSKDNINSNGTANGATSIDGAVPENAVATFNPNFGASLDWSPDEQSILEDLLSKRSLRTLQCKKCRTDANIHSLVFYLTDIVFTTVGIKSQGRGEQQQRQLFKNPAVSITKLTSMWTKNDSNSTFHSRGSDSQKMLPVIH
ncbi:unnamed protein product [Fraxinus pennsylvanica]|uniref:Uncharacterized protein n=1 Tax=Fraxinus pennsylvanica TaxID=56036 RepID=A0AAD2E0I3_9LAMI|nr:unnamed protein product [Fraxinus pennsylvanica]